MTSRLSLPTVNQTVLVKALANILFFSRNSKFFRPAQVDTLVMVLVLVRLR